MKQETPNDFPLEFDEKIRMALNKLSLEELQRIAEAAVSPFIQVILIVVNKIHARIT